MIPFFFICDGSKFISGWALCTTDQGFTWVLNTASSKKIGTQSQRDKKANSISVRGSHLVDNCVTGCFAFNATFLWAGSVYPVIRCFSNCSIATLV